jgi:hypothetical protein
MTTRKRKERPVWDLDFAVRTGLMGFDAYLAATNPKLAEMNRVWEAEVRIATEVLAEKEAA